MDKKFAYMFAIYSGIDTKIDVSKYEPELPEPVKSDSEIDFILKEIFSVDPRTGLPMGDIAYYLSPDGNPAVKDWLVNNLLKPRSGGNEFNPDLTDDLIVEMSRQHNESVDDYSSRLMGIYDDAKQFYDNEVAKLHQPVVESQSD